MKWYVLYLSVFSFHLIMGMEPDFLHQIPEEYVQKVKEKIRNGTGPKKLVNLVNRSCNGNLALQSYVLGKTWNKWIQSTVNFCPDPLCFFAEIIRQAKQCDDQLAIEVSHVMHAKAAEPMAPTSLLEYAIQMNSERGLGFLIQMGQDLRPEHLSLAIERGLPHLTALLLKARCPVELSYTMIHEHPLVVAVKKRDARAVNLLLTHTNPKEKFEYPDSMEKKPVIIEKYLNKQDLEYLRSIEKWLVV